MQRFRIKFGRGDEIKFISHLDIMRLWERTFIRAQIPIAHSEGFNPHPKMSLAAPLAVGVTSEAELMDIYTDMPITPHWFTSAVKMQLPPGINVLGVIQTALTLPSLQSQLRFADYKVEMDASEEATGEINQRVSAMLSSEHIPWRHHRDTGERTYDIRALIDELKVCTVSDSACTMEMRLRCDSNGSGRPEQVALALGFSRHPLSIHRTRLTLEA